MSKKLYEVRVELVSYVMAEDEVEAQQTGYESFYEEVKNIDPGTIGINEVVNPRWPLAPGWHPNCLVYGADQETPIAEALKKIR